jgi:hypothetical protein
MKDKRTIGNTSVILLIVLLLAYCSSGHDGGYGRYDIHFTDEE